MPNPARLVVYGNNNKPLPGPIPIVGPDGSDLTGSEIHEFSHQVFTIEKDYFYSLLYGVDFIRHHKPLSLVKPVDTMSVPLRKFLLEGTFLPKVEVRWYIYLEDHRNVREYFRMTMEHVRLHSMVMTLPDVKDPALEKYDHLEKITFCYQKITWLYNKGNLQFTDIWNGGFFAEEDEKNFSGQKDETDLAGEIVKLQDALVVTFTSGAFSIAPEEMAFDKKSDVNFTATFNREANMNERKVYAKLYAVCKGKTEDLRQVQEGRLSPDGKWTTTFTLKKPETLADSNGTEEQVEYYTEIENAHAAGKYKSESVKTPSAESEENLKLTEMSWKSDAARRGDTVLLEALFENCTKTTSATVEIYEYDHDGKHDSMTTISAEITDGKLEASWEYEYQDDVDDIVPEEEVQKTGGTYHPPEYFFVVKVGKQTWGDNQESSLLAFRDWIEVELQDEEGNPMADEPFELHLPDGSTQNGTLDDNGFARVDSVPPGRVEVVFTNYPSVTIKE